MLQGRRLELGSIRLQMATELSQIKATRPTRVRQPGCSARGVCATPAAGSDFLDACSSFFSLSSALHAASRALAGLSVDAQAAPIARARHRSVRNHLGAGAPRGTNR
jgi:hypothetical protein